MSSEIKVDTISENTSANGVVIDSVTLKDGGITATGNVGIGETNPDASLHITSNTPNISFDESDASQEFRIGSFGGIFAVHDTTDSAFRFLINGDGDLSTGGETAPDVDQGGLCLNQGGDDGNIMTFKSSDVAHGHTNTAQSDTFFVAEKKSSTNGGIKMSGFTDTGDGHAFEIAGIQESSNTAESTSASSAVCVNSFRRTGGTANTEAIPTSANSFGIKNGGDMQCLFKGDGEIHTNTAGGSNVGSVSTYDEYEDAQLVRAFDLSKGHYARGLIDSQFDKFVKYNIQDLIDANIIGTDDEGNPTSFVNITGLQRLHNGAIWQQYEKHQRLAEAVYEMAKEVLGKDKADTMLNKHNIKLLN